MKRYLTIFIFLNFFLSEIIFAQPTPVSGPQSGTWYLSLSPYRVIGDVTVDTGNTLTIEPGVVVNFSGLYRILVNGTLDAQGTILDSIIFEHESSGQYHYSLDFINASSSSILSYCRIEGGQATRSGVVANGYGGGVLFQDCSPVIEHCLVRNNAANFGGGIFVHGNSSPLIKANVIKNNVANNLGGGIGCIGADGVICNPAIINNIIYNNSSLSSTSGGGGLSFYFNCNVNLYNNTIYGNYTPGYGGGILIRSSPNVITVNNSILWANTAGTNGSEIYDVGSSITVSYSDIQGGWAGAGNGNINSDPLFVDVLKNYFYLLPQSPCIDAGTASGAPSTDFNENPTNQDGNNSGTAEFDIGAFEFLQDVQSFSSGTPGRSYSLDTFEGTGTQVASIILNGISGTGDLGVNCFTKSFPLNAPMGSKSVYRWYRITEEVAGLTYTDATLRLYYSTDELELGNLGASNLTLWKYEGGTWVNKGGVASNGYVEIAGVLASELLGDWAFADVSDNPLPVDLLVFKAEIIESGIQLNWSTASEINNLGFEIWKASSINGPYEMIASYVDNPALVGLGNSNIGKEYNYIDRNFELNCSIYYKLCSIDFDGSKSSYGPLEVKIDGDNFIKGKLFIISDNYPNPFNPKTHFSIRIEKNARLVFEVFNSLGQQVDKIERNYISPGEFELTWNGDKFSSGIYYYRMILFLSDDEGILLRKFRSGRMLLLK